MPLLDEELLEHFSNERWAVVSNDLVRNSEEGENFSQSFFCHLCVWRLDSMDSGII
jgi:hypothetical protein